MLKPGCTLANLVNICLHKSTDSKFYPFTESDNGLLEKIREYMVGGPSIIFTRKAVVDETFIRKSSNLCKSIVGIDASQLYPYTICQPMSAGLYTRWVYESETNRFTARQTQSRTFENMVLSYFQHSRPDCKNESNVTTGRQKKVDCFSVDGTCQRCNTVFEAMGCYFHYCSCQEARAFLTDTDFERGVQKWQQDEMRRDYIQKRFTKLLKCGSVSGGVFIKLMHQSKVTSEKIFHTDIHWVKKDLCKDLSMCNSLVMFNVILKCLNTWATSFPTFLSYSKILQWVGMILVIWWNSSQKRKIIFLSLEECSYQDFSNKGFLYNSFAFVLFATWASL